VKKRMANDIKNQDNGNHQLNSIRNDFNEKVGKMKFMGATPRMYWNDRRRFRTI
jgi:hypothetical protein|tara:strand:- start:262 stop:423 length:162 start_codon:yes stop_codon:yes gene_type:complete